MPPERNFSPYPEQLEQRSLQRLLEEIKMVLQRNVRQTLSVTDRGKVFEQHFLPRLRAFDEQYRAAVRDIPRRQSAERLHIELKHYLQEFLRDNGDIAEELIQWLEDQYFSNYLITDDIPGHASDVVSKDDVPDDIPVDEDERLPQRISSRRAAMGEIKDDIVTSRDMSKHYRRSRGHDRWKLMTGRDRRRRRVDKT